MKIREIYRKETVFLPSLICYFIRLSFRSRKAGEKFFIMKQQNKISPFSRDDSSQAIFWNIIMKTAITGPVIAAV